jgi:hypothetical protein
MLVGLFLKKLGGEEALYGVALKKNGVILGTLAVYLYFFHSY